MQEADKPEIFRWAGHSHVFRSGAGARTIPDWVRALRGRLDYFGFGHPWDAGDLELIRSIEGNPEALEAYFLHGTAGGDALRVERFERWKRECEGFLCGIDLETPKIRYGHLWWLDWLPLHPPWHDYDQPWGAWEGAGRIGPPPPFARRMPAEVVREQVAAGAVPVYAHPTSWWTGPHDQFVTNIASTLVPDLLTGQFRGAMVVMGYDARQDSYRALWFDLLNRGVFVPGVAETDACLDSEAPFRDGLLHNVCEITKPWTLEKLKRAVEAGEGTMTSGPQLDLRCGESRAGGRTHNLPAKVVASAKNLRPGVNYQLTILANGQPVAGMEFAASTPDENAEVTANVVREGWVVATLDGPEPRREAAITNPILLGNRVQCVNARPLAKNPTAYWHNPDAQSLLNYLIHGEFRRDFPGLEPGQVPPEAFRWDDWCRVLEKMTESAGMETPSGLSRHLI
jgi:hypothetical protein